MLHATPIPVPGFRFRPAVASSLVWSAQILTSLGLLTDLEGVVLPAASVCGICVCVHPRVHVYVRMPERIWQVVVYERESVRVMSFLLEYC